MNQSAADEGAALCEIKTISKVLQICWGKKNCNCVLGSGAFGRVFKGKWKENPEANSSINVAVKQPTGPYHVEYEIATLKKANGHRNILEFYGQVDYGPDG